MASPIWIGGALDNDWSNALNWSTGAIPVDGDSVTITGAQDITAGLAQGGITLASFTRGEACTAKIGSASTPLTLGHITSLNDSGRSSYTKIALSSGSGEDGICTTANISVATGCNFMISGGTWTTVNVSSKSGGDITIDSTATVTTLRNVSANVNVTASTGTGFTTVENMGYLLSRRNITTHTSLGADRLTVTDAATMGTYNGSGNSLYNHQSSGTITTLNVRPGGSFPCTGATKSFTITTTNLYSGGYVNQMPFGVTITFTNPINYIGEQVSRIGGQGL